MNKDRWTKIQTIFEKVIKLSESSQYSFLKDQCQNDDVLFEEIISLVHADQNVHEILNGLAIDTFQNITSKENIISKGSIIGPYSVKKTMATGGMGEVYLALRNDGQLEKEVAIKVIKKGMDSDQIVSRFNQEKQILSQLQHPGIVQIIDAGLTLDNRPWFSMEFVDGVSITDYCNENKLTINQRLKLFQAVCETISYAHRNLIVHRDLKPNNILVNKDGEIKLLDFGISKLLEAENKQPQITQAGQFVLTPEYAAPEQFTNSDISVSSDVYQLGVILFELLNGERPYSFKNQTPIETYNKLLKTQPSMLSYIAEDRIVSFAENCSTSVKELKTLLKSDLNYICQKAIRKEPRLRYLTIDALHEDVQRYIDSRPVYAKKGSFIYRSQKFIKRNKSSILISSFLLITMVSIVFYHTSKLAIERDKAKFEAKQKHQVSAFLINLFELSDPNVSQGTTITARELLDKSRQDIKKRLAGQPLLQAQMYNVLGQVYSKLALFDTAKVLLTKAINLRKNFAQNTNELAVSYKNMARVLLEKGEYDKSLELLDSAQNILVLNSEKPTLELAAVLNLKGWYSYHIRDFESAQIYFMKSFEIDSMIFGVNSADVAQDINDLALSQKRLGNYESSEQLQRKAIAIKTKLFGEESFELSTEYFNLAKLMHMRDDFEQADSLFNKALKMDRIVLGENHSDLAKILMSYSYLKKDMSDFKKATQFTDEAYNINLNIFGENHPSVASNLDFKARLLRYAGKYEESIKLHTQALKLKRNIWGDVHPSVANTINNLGRVYDAKNDLIKAEKYYRQAMEMVHQIQGKSDPEAASMLHNLAMSVYNQEDYQRAEPLIEESLKSQQALHHENHRRVLDEKNNLAKVYLKLGKLPQAEKIFREVLKSHQGLREKGHRYIGRSMDNVAFSLLLQDKVEEAEIMFLESFEILKKVSGLKDPHTQKVVKHLVKVYEILTKPARVSYYKNLITPK